MEMILRTRFFCDYFHKDIHINICIIYNIVHVLYIYIYSVFLHRCIHVVCVSRNLFKQPVVFSTVGAHRLKLSTKGPRVGSLGETSVYIEMYDHLKN